MAGADLVGPRMPDASGLQGCGQFGRLGRAQRHRPAHDLQFTASVPPTHRDFGLVDAARDRAHDHFDRLALFDLLEGWIWCRALSR
jgi:hypothetical protein